MEPLDKLKDKSGKYDTPKTCNMLAAKLWCGIVEYSTKSNIHCISTSPQMLDLAKKFIEDSKLETLLISEETALRLAR